MKLSFLTKDLDFELVNGNMDIDITGIATDHREDLRGKIFVAIHGYTFNGHDFLDQAARNCASVAIVSEDAYFPKHMCVLKVKDTKEALAIISRTFFDYPDEKLVTIGITGTKGKTTTAFYIRSILNEARQKAGLIGTIENDNCHVTTKSVNTTPSSYEVYRICSEVVKNGGKYLVMEVSSQAIKEKRLWGMEFDIGILTNISKDHIGPSEHKDYEEYKGCKAAFIRSCNRAFTCGDFAECCEMAKEAGTYGLGTENQLVAKELKPFRTQESLGIEFLVEELDIRVNQPGVFSVYNALGALAVARELGIGTEAIRQGLEKCQVPGRCQVQSFKDGAIILTDYAHNGIALENLLKEISAYPHGRIITVFGCGGDRDPSRRKEMGHASARYSDLTIITQDNSRRENPMSIMEQIASALYEEGGQYYIEPDRKKAIEYAMEKTQKSDIIIVAGKGHETYQIVGDEILHFDDFETIKNILKEKYK